MDIDAKKLAIFSGRGIFKCYAESEPDFKFRLFVTDHYDFYVDPAGGGNLENAAFLGEDNIYKTKSQLLEGAKAKVYDRLAVAQLVNGITPNSILGTKDTYANKEARFASLGLTMTAHNFSGEGALRFIESGTIVDGKRYRVLWNYESGLALRCVPIEEDFESGLWWWTSWATNRDSFNFWSKAPADDIRPVADVIKVMANQDLDNRQKRNFGQRAYDPDIFPNPAELEFRPNGLVATKSGSSSVRAISQGIYEFVTPELTGTIDLINWMDNFIGQKSGVTAAAQGAADQQRVGIYQGDMREMADRLGLINKSYSRCWSAIGRRFVWGCKEHLNKAAAVKLIGAEGVEWDELKGDEVNPETSIVVESGGSEMQVNAAKKMARTATLAAIAANGNLVTGVNAKWLVEQMLLNSEFTPEEVRVAQDTLNNSDREVLARAAEAIEEIVEGDEPKLFRGATTAFQQKILDYALENTDGDLPLFNKLLAYSSKHDTLVQENMTRRATAMAPLAAPGGLPGAPEGGLGVAGGVPGPGPAPAPTPGLPTAFSAGGSTPFPIDAPLAA